MIKTIFRFEGLMLFLLCLFFYNQLHASWLIFFVLWLLPDLSAVGYLKNSRIGAATYNLIHNYILAGLIIFIGFWLKNNFIISLGIILASHVSLDRFCGYGLKFPSGFKDTHMQKYN